MAAIQSIEDKDNEHKLISQFTQGIHDKIVRNDVRRYVLTHSERPGFASWHVLDAAKHFAKDHGVKEGYCKSYEECASLLRKRQDTKVSVSNINTPEKSTRTDTKTAENKQRDQKEQGARHLRR